MIIPLMQEDAVDVYHWMTDAQFLNAVALGQVTPGPVVATVAAVGYAAHGVGGALLAAAVAFAPSFSFILLGGGRFERLRGNDRARGFLDGAGPAAIGAILGSAVTLAGGLTESWQIGVLAGAAIALLVVRRGVVETLVARRRRGRRTRLGRSAPPVSWPHGGGHRHDGSPAGPRRLRGRAARPPDPDEHRQPARQRGQGPGVPPRAR